MVDPCDNLPHDNATDLMFHGLRPLITMRRTLASALLVLLSFPLIAPALANTASELPACCRRSGEHHCAIAEQTGSAQTVFQNRCPVYPNGIAVATMSRDVAVSTSARAAAPPRLSNGSPMARPSHRPNHASRFRPKTRPSCLD